MRDNKERKTNIILISLSILCLIICLLIIVFNRGVEEKNVVLVKDLQDGESRIISDKTDSLSNTGGTFVYKAEEPEGLLNPDDVFKETNNIIIESNTNGRVDNKINRKEENPLELVEPGTVIDVLKEEAIETDVIEEPTLEELLEEARIKRNSGRQELYKSFALFNQKGDICYSNLLKKNLFLFSELIMKCQFFLFEWNILKSLCYCSESHRNFFYDKASFHHRKIHLCLLSSEMIHTN